MVRIAHIQVSQGGEINEPIKIVILIQPIVLVEIKRNQAQEISKSGWNGSRNYVVGKIEIYCNLASEPINFGRMEK
jgi:hypothetical protein